MKADEDVATEKGCPPPCDQDNQLAMKPDNPDGDSSLEIKRRTEMVAQLRGRM